MKKLIVSSILLLLITVSANAQCVWERNAAGTYSEVCYGPWGYYETGRCAMDANGTLDHNCVPQEQLPSGIFSMNEITGAPTDLPNFIEIKYQLYRVKSPSPDSKSTQLSLVNLQSQDIIVSSNQIIKALNREIAEQGEL